MDTTTMIIGAVVIALCMLPFVIMGSNKKKRKAQLLKSLSEIAAGHDCKITRHEFFDQFIIGLDDAGSYAFFLKKSKDDEVSEYVDLSVVQKCKVVNSSRVAGGNVIITDKVELSFLSVDKKNPDKKFELYTSEESMQLTGELQLAEKWAEEVNLLLKAIQRKK